MTMIPTYVTSVPNGTEKVKLSPNSTPRPNQTLDIPMTPCLMSEEIAFLTSSRPGAVCNSIGVCIKIL